jgi:hypothetical protein
LQPLGYLMLGAVGLWYYAKYKNKQHHAYWLIIVLYVFSVLGIAVILPSSKYYYFNTILPLMLVLGADMVARVSRSRNTWWKIGLFLVIALYLVSPTKAYYDMLSFSRTGEPSLSIGIRAVRKESDLLMSTFGNVWPYHMGIVNYDAIAGRKNTGALEAYWAGLEQETKTPLVSLVPLGKSYEPLASSPTHMVIVCTSFLDLDGAQKGCADRFIKEYPTYSHIRPIYVDVQESIYYIFWATQQP